MIDIQRAFREILHRDDAVRALVGERITPFQAQQTDADSQPAAHIVYHMISRNIERHLKGPIPLAMSRMQADLYATSYSTVQELAAAVNQATNGYSGRVEVSNDSLKIRSMRIDEWQELREDENSASETSWHRVSMDFVIWHEHDVPLFAQ